MMTGMVRHPGWLLAVLLFGQLIVNIDLAIVNIASPSIQQRLGASGGEVEFVVSGYILVYAVLLITGARLGDTYGYRRVFMTGLALFTVASLGCGLAPNTIILIVARVVQGAAAAMMVPQVLSGIQLHFSGRARVRAIGHYGVALSAGAVAGQVLGGVLVSADLFGSGWRPIFLINVPLGIVLFAAAWRFLPTDGARRTRGLDLIGVAVLSVALLLLIVPLVLGREHGWPAWTWLCLAASMPALAGFVLVERWVTNRDGAPLINLAVIVRPPVRWGLIAHGASTLTYLALLFVLALFLQQGLGKSAAYSGFALVSWVAAFGVAGWLLPRLPARVTQFVPAAGCSLLAGAYLVSGLGVATGYQDSPAMFVVLGVGGFGLGLSSGSLITHLTTATPIKYAPDISGVISTNAQLWGAAGVAMAGTAYLSLVDGPDPGAAPRAFVLIMAGFALLAAFSAVAAWWAVRCQAGAEPGESVEHGTAGDAPTRLGAIRS